MPRIHQASEGAATSRRSKVAAMKHSPGRSVHLVNQSVNLSVASAPPPSNDSLRGRKGCARDGPHHACENGAFQSKKLFGASKRPLPVTSPSDHKEESGRKRLRQMVEDRGDRKAGKCSSTSVKGSAIGPTTGQCRQPLRRVQPRNITDRPISLLPRLSRRRTHTAANNEAGPTQAQPFVGEILPQSLPVGRLSDQCRQQIADLQAEASSSHQGSHLPQHIQPCVPLAEQEDSGLMQSHPLPTDALPLGECIREPPEAVMDDIQAKMCAPPRSKSIVPPTDHVGNDTRLSSGSSYSPWRPRVSLYFKTPDFERYRSPFRGCPLRMGGGELPTLQCDGGSPALASPITATTNVEKILDFPIPDSPVHYTDALEPSGSAEKFPLPNNVTLRRQATRNVSPLTLPEFLPKHLTERLESKPDDGKDNESGESDCDENAGGAALSSSRAATVPHFPSPDLAAYRRVIREEMAKCDGAHLASPATSTNSPAITASVGSTSCNVASSPTAEIAPASSPSTLDTAFAESSAQPLPSPIFESNRQERFCLSTVMECTEMGVEGSTMTALLPYLEESLITNTRQPSLIDGNFSMNLSSMALCHKELEQEFKEPNSDSRPSLPTLAPTAAATKTLKNIL